MEMNIERTITTRIIKETMNQDEKHKTSSIALASPTSTCLQVPFPSHQSFKKVTIVRTKLVWKTMTLNCFEQKLFYANNLFKCEQKSLYIASSDEQTS